MVFALALLVVVGLFLAVVPAAALGLAAAVVSARWPLGGRIALLIAVSGAVAAGWALLLKGGFPALLVVPLAGTAALFAGGAGIVWSATRRRPAAPWYSQPVHLARP